MTQYNFDQVIERQNTLALKTDVLLERYGDADLIPLWVADMDFATPDFIINALQERLQHPILGYPSVPQSYYNSIIEWVFNQHQWQVSREWISYIPGIVKGIGMVLQVFTKPGDKVIIQSPVYHPFRIVPEENERPIVWNPLKQVNGAYQMDFEQLESIIDSDCKVLILCNPHNPGGIVWDTDTLRELARICAKHQILVISDEIHADLAHSGHKHQPFATVSAEAAANSITFMAPSKTFNIAGIVSSYAIVPDATLRNKFYKYMVANEFNDIPLFPIIATEAAYTHGKNWVTQMMQYVEANQAYVETFMAHNIPNIKVYKTQASFLIWLDCSELHLTHDELINLFVKEAKLALNDGEMFGPGGEAHMRMNIGCPIITLEKALNQLKNAIDRRR